MGSQAKIVGAISLTGVVASMWCECTFGEDSFKAFLENFLFPELQPGNIVVMDNVSFHKTESIINIIESVGARVVFLPPYHPELNPIEHMWSKFKMKLKKLIGKGEEYATAVKKGLMSVTPSNCEGWFENCDYFLS